MNYPTHLIAGLAVGITANEYIIQNLSVIDHLNLPIAVSSSLFIGGSVFGSLLPDIDHRGSYLGRRLPFLSFLTHSTLGHRGATHAPLVTIAMASLFSTGIHLFLNNALELLCLIALAGITLGAFSHIFMDALTKFGVPIFYPFSNKHYRLAKFKTGGLGEYIISALMIFYIIWLYSGELILKIILNILN